MPQTTITPRNGSVLVGTANPPATEVRDQVLSVAIPTNPQQVTVPPTYGVDSTTRYVGAQRTLIVRFLQDWSVAAASGGLARFLEDNDGEFVWLLVRPTDATVPSWLVEFQAIAPDVLGDAGAVLESTMTFPVRTFTPDYTA